MNVDHDGLSCPDSQPLPNKGMVHVRVRGKDERKFARLRAAFIRMLEDVCKLQADHERGTTVGDETKQIMSSLLDFAKAKLAQPGADVQKTLAEATKSFAEAKEALARTRKTDAEAYSIELDNRVKELRLRLTLHRVVILQHGGDAAILMGQQIDEILLALKEMSAETALLEGKHP